MAARRELLLLSVAFIACCALSAVHATSFVQRSGHQLVVNGQPFYFTGANAYWLVDAAKAGYHSVLDQFFQACNAHSLRVVRFWALNHNSPNGWGSYDDSEMRGFDSIVASAGRHNIRLIMSLGNTWRAYRSPEDLMRLAGDSPSGKTLLEFYQSPQLKAFFKNHMKTFVAHVNSFTGVAYKDDPTIMMWDVFNEPRCPGCQEQWQQQVHQAWLQDMSTTLKSYAPSQLVAAGTEGYFMDAENLPWNPGAGALCEGEDWVAINRLSGLDVTVAHIYDRQMENVPPGWERPTFEDLLNWFQRYLERHVSVAMSLGKPFLVEEFNVLIQRYTDAQRAQLFQLVYDYLHQQKSVGGPMMGALFWNAAIGNSVADDGYNIYLDDLAGGRRLLASTRRPIDPNLEGLDAFRRGPQRQACAEAAAKWWRPLWRQSQYRTVNIASLQQRTQGKTTAEVIRDNGV